MAFQAQVLRLGCTVALAILLPLGIGIWLDQQYQTTERWYTLAGVVLGTLLGTTAIWFLTRAQYRALDDAYKQDSNPSQRPSTPQPPKTDDMKEDDS